MKIKKTLVFVLMLSLMIATFSFPANRAVLPGYFFGRFVMVTTAVINGKTFYSPLPIA